MLAQRQPSFKERVIAHWSSDSAPKMIGTKFITEAADGVFSYVMVEERCMRSEADMKMEVDFIQVTMQA